MAIKFKDRDPEDGKQPRKTEPARPSALPESPPQPEPAGSGELPGLPLAKLEPKKRGRKKPFA